MAATPEGTLDFKFTRACFGMAASFAIAISVTLVTRPKSPGEIQGLTIWTVRHRSSTSRAAQRRSHKLRTTVVSAPEAAPSSDGETTIPLTAAARARLAVEAGDVVFVDDARFWLGGLRSVRGVVAEAADEGGALALPHDIMARNRWREGQRVVIERVD